MYVVWCFDCILPHDMFQLGDIPSFLTDFIVPYVIILISISYCCNCIKPPVCYCKQTRSKSVPCWQPAGRSRVSDSNGTRARTIELCRMSSTRKHRYTCAYVPRKLRGRAIRAWWFWEWAKEYGWFWTSRRLSFWRKRQSPGHRSPNSRE